MCPEKELNFMLIYLSFFFFFEIDLYFEPLSDAINRNA